jgi:primosomal protein N' (replication factor Y)
MRAKVVVIGSAGDVAALTYAVPARFEAALKPGHRVIVPVRSRMMTGIVIETGAHLDSGGKEPRELDLADETPLFDDAHLKLLDFLAGYYLTTLGDAFRSVVPAIGRVESRKLFYPGAPPDPLKLATISTLERAILDAINRRPAGMRSLARLADITAVTAAIGQLIKAGLVRTDSPVHGRHRTDAPAVARLAEGASSAVLDGLRGRIQRALVGKLAEAGSAGVSLKDLRAESGGFDAALRSLSKRGLIELEKNGDSDPRTVAVLDRNGNGNFTAPGAEDSIVLSAEQDAAVKIARGAVEARRYETFLLWGVTASGKTEVYLRAAAAALAIDRQVIVLVPEIALADQVVTSFRARFGDLVAIAHSAQNVAERWSNWMAAVRGRARIMIGPRSAIFAPMHDPGLIIVDEEHDPAYKQEDGIRYNARDLAVALASFAACPVILGSATPSAESWFNARAGRYRMLRLTTRVMERPLADVEVIDLRREKRAVQSNRKADEPDSPIPLSAPLVDAIRENLASGGQTLLFINRRGYHNYLQCHLCGAVITCSSCSVSMTFHMHDRSLRCHYCGERRAAPETCPGCGGLGLEGLGFGTERLAAILTETISGARIARMDSDTSGRLGERSRMLGALARGEIDILVGTQMITKGFDFPGVTLVGVVLADLALNMPDFRSAERTFQLLTQVAGRAGRGERAGRVLIQTYSPGHYSIRAARDQDYSRFIRRELELRRELGYPPFTRIAMVRIDAEESAAAGKIAAIAARLLGTTPGLRILGPAPAPIERIRQRYRWQVMVKATAPREMRAALAAMRAEVAAHAARENVRLAIDIDPVNML